MFRVFRGFGVRGGFSHFRGVLKFLGSGPGPFTPNPDVGLIHFQVGSYRYRRLVEGLYTLQKPYRSPIDPKP